MIGFSTCAIVLNTLQFIIVYRINWIDYAQKTHENSKIKVKVEVESITDETSTKKSSSLKWIILKRGIVYLIIVTLFSASFITNSIKYFENEAITNLTSKTLKKLNLVNSDWTLLSLKIARVNI